MSSLPTDYRPYTDTYFLRSLEILQKENINPYIRAQFFIRKGPGTISGIEEAVKVLLHYTGFLKNSGNIFALPELESFSSGETVLLLEGKAQDIIPLETMMLGIMSEETTRVNDGFSVETNTIKNRVEQIKKAIGDRSLLYFGARHFKYTHDVEITSAAFEGGASESSTDIGVATKNKKGVGTIPHSLECIFSWKYGLQNAVVETVKSFDKWISPTIPRVALVDFANKEIDDALACCNALENRLFGIRIDTCGENTMQGVTQKTDHTADPFWYGTGVTISGVYAVRRSLIDAGYPDVKIILSSGFGDIHKVNAFVTAEKELGMKLFDTLGVGEVLPVRTATMDIVGVGETIDSLQPVSKVGRSYAPNNRLRKVEYPLLDLSK